ncbi:unnamed protein product [Fusarium venenatum]|uniref:Uncharacterized protein n=1 Tax=Fusarium venenatum TaxID=56646 RepID=A0A2L2SY49_9HYPO|nr:unnamed protein product [Fusarium venenatum]
MSNQLHTRRYEICVMENIIKCAVPYR